MTQQTQGGMGHDTRDGAEAVDPARPQPEVQAMMEDLHAFVTSDGNLPYLANWLRLDAPRRILPRRRPPTRKSGSTPPPARTATNRRFQDWSESNHRLMGNSHPTTRWCRRWPAKPKGRPSASGARAATCPSR